MSKEDLRRRIEQMRAENAKAQQQNNAPEGGFSQPLSGQLELNPVQEMQTQNIRQRTVEEQPQQRMASGAMVGGLGAMGDFIKRSTEIEGLKRARDMRADAQAGFGQYLQDREETLSGTWVGDYAGAPLGTTGRTLERMASDEFREMPAAERFIEGGGRMAMSGAHIGANYALPFVAPGAAAARGAARVASTAKGTAQSVAAATGTAQPAWRGALARAGSKLSKFGPMAGVEGTAAGIDTAAMRSADGEFTASDALTTAGSAITSGIANVALPVAGNAVYRNVLQPIGNISRNVGRFAIGATKNLQRGVATASPKAPSIENAIKINLPEKQARQVRETIANLNNVSRIDNRTLRDLGYLTSKDEASKEMFKEILRSGTMEAAPYKPIAQQVSAFAKQNKDEIARLAKRKSELSDARKAYKISKDVADEAEQVLNNELSGLGYTLKKGDKGVNLSLMEGVTESLSKNEKAYIESVSERLQKMRKSPNLRNYQNLINDLDNFALWGVESPSGALTGVTRAVRSSANNALRNAERAAPEAREFVEINQSLQKRKALQKGLSGQKEELLRNTDRRVEIEGEDVEIFGPNGLMAEFGAETVADGRTLFEVQAGIARDLSTPYNFNITRGSRAANVDAKEFAFSKALNALRDPKSSISKFVNEFSSEMQQYGAEFANERQARKLREFTTKSITNMAEAAQDGKKKEVRKTMQGLYEAGEGMSEQQKSVYFRALNTAFRAAVGGTRRSMVRGPFGNESDPGQQ